jgi:hypothetical protein
MAGLASVIVLSPTVLKLGLNFLPLITRGMGGLNTLFQNVKQVQD